MKIELEFALRCSRCLHELKARQNCPGSKTLYSVDPCEHCLKDKETEILKQRESEKTKNA